MPSGDSPPLAAAVKSVITEHNMTPAEIEALLYREGGGLANDAGADADEEIARRTHLLADVLLTAQHLWYQGSEEIDLVAEKIGDASRQAAWRIPFGDSGILDFFLGVIAIHGIRPALKVHTLRLIGNSCADTDENRARVVAANAIPGLVSQLLDDDVLAFVIPVLYNVLVDYGPAQLQACNASLSLQLINLISGPRLMHCQHFLALIGKILALLVTQEPEPTLAHPQSPFILLNLALNPEITTDAEDFVSLTIVALVYLANAHLQEQLVSLGNMPTFLDAFYQAQTRFDPSLIDDEEVSLQLRQLRTNFVQVIADLSYAPSFPYMCALGTPVIQTIEYWLQLPDIYLQSGACLALGNIARSDEASAALVLTDKIHAPVVAILANPETTDSLLLHSALSLLKNLAIPSPNKAILGDAGLFNQSILPRIWAIDSVPQVQFAGISLARLLLINTPTNVRRVCAPLSPDPLSPAHDLTQVHRLLDVFNRTDNDATKTEAARAIISICRVLHTTPVPHILLDWDPSDDGYTFRPEKPLSPASQISTPSSDGTGGGGRRERFYRQHAGMNKALGYLASQSRFPVLRSEAWFIFALMARSRDGALMVMHVLQPPAAFEALMQAVTGRSITGEDPVDSGPGAVGTTGSVMESSAALVADLGLEPQQADPKQAADMARVDRENGLVLVAEMIRHYPDELPPLRRSAYEDMLKEGGELVAGYRDHDQSRVKGKEPGI